MVDIHILTYNVQGLGGISKRVDIFDYLKKKKMDIYCLQDTHFTDADESFIRSQWNTDCIFSNGRSNARGVAILFGKDLDYQVHKQILAEYGNFIVLDITFCSQRCTLVNLYGPNSDCPKYL